MRVPFVRVTFRSLFPALAWLAVRVWLPAHAEAPKLPAPPEGFRIGMEIELLPEAFANMTRYFDFDDLQSRMGEQISRNLPEDFFQDYLKDNPRAFSELPEDLRAALSEGLPIADMLVKDGAPPGSLLGPDGKPIGEQPLISRQEGSRLILPASQEPRKPTSGSRLEVPAQKSAIPKALAWQTLHGRWNALSPEIQRGVVRWENLPPLKKSLLAIDFAAGLVPVKENLPEREKHLFERLSWSRDRDAIEFRHREDLSVSDLKEFYRDVTDLARLAGPQVETRILDPDNGLLRRIEGNAPSSTFQYHVSTEGKDLRSRAQALNRLYMLRDVERGIIDDLTRQVAEGHNPMHLYDPSALGKGHVRIISKERMEIRTHHLLLHEELAFISSTIMSDEAGALKAIDSEITKTMTDSVVERIARHRPMYLVDFEKYLTPEQTQNVDLKLSLARHVKTRDHSHLPSDYWSRAHRWITGSDPSLRELTILSLAAHKEKLPDSLWKQIAFAASSSSDPGLLGAIADVVRYKPEWPESFWKEIPRLLRGRDPLLQAQLLSALHSRRRWPDSFWKEAPHILTDLTPETKATFLSAAESQDDWPIEFKRLVAESLKDESPKVVMRALRAMSRRSDWSAEQWKSIGEGLGHPDPVVRKEVYLALARQSDLPNPIWRTILAQLKDSTSPVDHAVLDSFLKSRTELPELAWKEIPELLLKSPPEVKASLASMLSRLSWPENFWNAVATTLLEHPLPAVRNNVWRAFSSQSHWPNFVQSKLEALRVSADGQLRTQARSALERRKGNYRKLGCLGRSLADLSKLKPPSP